MRIPDAGVSGMVRTYKVSIHEAEEECLRAQGQPEVHSKTLFPNLEKKISKTTNNQCTFIYIHSTNIYPTNIHSYTCIQPRYIHMHTFNQDTFMHNQQPTGQFPISSDFEFTQHAYSTVNTVPTLRPQATPVPSDSTNFWSFCICKYERNQDITLARQGRDIDV